MEWFPWKFGLAHQKSDWSSRSVSVSSSLSSSSSNDNNKGRLQENLTHKNHRYVFEREAHSS